ncbi:MULTISPECIES: helix-turn-helix domain-containing protein [Enterococcus]|uniref:helix-turn-helix domain-containing protein n=1 Tax=Enterococcus TaxID=1350 RepID=UPI0010F79CFB|nr:MULTISPECIES: helix-turn-helix domain-containing protein [Enterococcus]KAF1300948.1 hypothetical protein BAU16_11250 [Enterococcus sp. JM9B]
MFDCLLEERDRVLVKVYQKLAVEKKYSLEDAASECQHPVRYIRETVNDWRDSGSHLQIGIDVIIKKEHLVLQKATGFDDRYFFAFLLKRSIKIQLLEKLLEHPSWGVRDLEKTLYLSPKIIRRHFHELGKLFKWYGLTASFKKQPVICGAEAQQRFFRFHIRLLLEPPKMPITPAAYFQILEEISRKRRQQGYAIDPNWFDRKFISQINGIPDFEINERGFCFLWRQLLGVEEIWPMGISDELLGEQKIYPLDQRYSSRRIRQKILQDIFRLHLLCYLFKGPCIHQLAPLKTSQKNQQLLTALNELLPYHAQLLVNHPELELAYETVFQQHLEK